MGGILERQPGRCPAKLNYLLSPRALQRRPLVLLALVAILGLGIFAALGRLSERCARGGRCGLAILSPALPASPSEPTPDRDPGLNQTVTANGRDRPPECAGFPDTSNVLVVMKTGASEAFGKIPNQLLTSLRCIPEYYFFSDMAQKVAGHTVFDSLDTVLPSVMRNNEDFDIYLRQKTCPVDLESCHKHHNVAKQGWDLDKYKNIHMAEKVYAMRPNYDWYMFIDADTYVFWPTLVKWLEKLDPQQPHYIGSVAYVGDVPFGHGGSGYLTSQASLSKLFKGKKNVANGWDKRVKRECCGDFVFALALRDNAGIDVKNAWPTINGEKPHTLPYADDEWCHPIVTTHHVGAQEVSDLYAFEQERNFTYPMRIKDLFHRFVREQLMPKREDWDNLSDDVFYLDEKANQYSDDEKAKAKKGKLTALEHLAHQSFDDCRRACSSLSGCFQFRFWHGICAISHKIKHGHPTKEEPDRHWQYVSGWNVRKIEEWVEENDECGDAEFPFTD